MTGRFRSSSADGAKRIGASLPPGSNRRAGSTFPWLWRRVVLAQPARNFLPAARAQANALCNFRQSNAWLGRASDELNCKKSPALVAANLQGAHLSSKTLIEQPARPRQLLQADRRARSQVADDLPGGKAAELARPRRFPGGRSAVEASSGVKNPRPGR